MTGSGERETKFVKWSTAEGTNIRRVVAVMSGKGGVGKSSVTALLAVALAKTGLKVGILDADITGPTIPQMFDVRGVPEGSEQGMLPPESSLGIKIMSLQLLVDDEDTPAILRAPLITGTIKRFWTDVAWGELDCLLVDLPPGTGDAPLSVMQSLPLDGVVMVSSPQKIAVGVVKKALNMARRMNIPVVGLVENMSYVECGKCGEKMYVFGPSSGGQLADDFGLPFLGAVPLDPLLVELADRGRIEEYDHPVFGAVMEPLTEKYEILR
ncbi:MAG: Mrp/NBP35 family ATP-binding protein [Bacillota bacterium]|nr:Mrp/NBP35 family ATP-binding protein [Bacillota bacterium]MDW7682742.1 Mrp/NBP35 family ATP-binding protein [Bacillota bacterium]